MTTVEDETQVHETHAPDTEIGKARLRKEDRRLITGRTKFTDNIQMTGMLHLSMVRSPFAHATMTSIDTTAAKAMNGVIEVLTGEDIKHSQGSLPTAWPITEDQKAAEHPAIAVDRVAFAGEIVAVVIARTNADAR
ncbi:MAG: xanthine dehydrogenase family protein molybdopterin-binding subunit, partial [Ornithinimicrobium sp.]